MREYPGDMTGGVAVVIVLFHPEPDNLVHLRMLAEAGEQVIAVSNGMTPADREALSEVHGVSLIDNGENAGLAHALNQGIERALLGGARAVLLLDQDSRITPTLIAALARTGDRLRLKGVRVGCVAPRLVDRKAPDAIVGVAGEPQSVATSGSLITREALHDVGPMWDALFIDGIDHEWCFRARAKGYAIVVDRDAALAHDMGDDGVRIGGRFRPVHRSPFRHFHIIRNTLWLQRCRYIPLRWRMSELLKSAYRAPIYLLVSNNRRATLSALVRAVVTGLAGPPRPPGALR
jgi:rhamnosyltransferase